MATSESYRDYILDQLSALAGVSSRAMMGEYVLYVDGKVVGGLYDDRLLVKITDASTALLPHARRALPYEGAKPMLLVEETDDRAFLATLFTALAAALPPARGPHTKKDV